MLQTLSIKQFAIIDTLEIHLSDGLTVLSGETGAGKSIIIDAIGQLIGMRASSDYVRHGEKKAIIEGIFDIDESKDAISILEDMSIDVDEDFLLVKREILALVKVFAVSITKSLHWQICDVSCKNYSISMVSMRRKHY